MTIKDGGITALDRIAECVTELQAELDAVRKTTIKASKAFVSRLAADESGTNICATAIFGDALRNIGKATEALDGARLALNEFDTFPPLPTTEAKR